MIPVTSLRPGITFEENGDIFEVITYSNVHLRKTSSVVKVKARSLRRGMTIEKSYVSNAKVNKIILEKKDLQFLYKDNEFCHFMDPQTFDQIDIPLKNIDKYEYLKEGGTVPIRFYNKEAISMFIGPKVKLKVVDTTPGVKGNSATNVYKDAKLENGMQIKVPLFIKIGDIVLVDTRDDSYTERAK